MKFFKNYVDILAAVLLVACFVFAIAMATVEHFR